jgi:hypothetical protein
MAVSDQNRFQAAVRIARASGAKADWDAAANILSSLGMGDILPALVALEPAARDSVRWGATRALVRAASRRIEFAITAVADHVLDTLGDDLPSDQVDEVRRFLLVELSPKHSQASNTAFSTMNAAAVRAITECAPVTAALRVEFSGSIYKRGATYRFTPPKSDFASSSSSSSNTAPHGTTWVALYHTHPAGNANAENFSPQDLLIGRGIKNGNTVVRPALVLFVGTPSGRIKKLTPPDLLDGADVVFGPAPDQSRWRAA